MEASGTLSLKLCRLGNGDATVRLAAAFKIAHAARLLGLRNPECVSYRRAPPARGCAEPGTDGDWHRHPISSGDLTIGEGSNGGSRFADPPYSNFRESSESYFNLLHQAIISKVTRILSASQRIGFVEVQVMDQIIEDFQGLASDRRPDRKSTRLNSSHMSIS